MLNIPQSYVSLSGMTTETELREIRLLLAELNKKVDLMEERLIGCEEPTKEDIEEIEAYETAKKTKNCSLNL
jgi:hypothetical protein